MKTTTESWWVIWETFVNLSFWQGFYPIPALLHLVTLSSNHINIIWQSGLATWSLESGRLLFPVRPKIHQLEHLPLWRILVVSVLDAPQGSVTKFRIYIYRWIMGFFSYLTPFRGRKARSHCCSGNNVFLLDRGNIICIQTYIYTHPWHGKRLITSVAPYPIVCWHKTWFDIVWMGIPKTGIPISTKMWVRLWWLLCKTNCSLEAYIFGCFSLWQTYARTHP